MLFVETLLAIASVLLCLVAVVRHPQQARCPGDWSVMGVRESGYTICTPPPPPNCGEPTGAYQQPCPDDPRELGIQIYCTGGSLPIVVDSRTVGCQR